MRLDLFCETEEEKEVILRLKDRPNIVRFPRSEQVRRFYKRYGLDWIQKFYQNYISLDGLPKEEDKPEIGY